MFQIIKFFLKSKLKCRVVAYMRNSWAACARWTPRGASCHTPEQRAGRWWWIGASGWDCRAS